MRLFLCALLARKPVVTQGIVTGLNGDRFFDLYVPELGLELRIQTVDIQPAPVLNDWNKDARCDPTPYAPPPPPPMRLPFQHSIRRQNCACSARASTRHLC